jgi:hypothetical protein
LKYLQELAFQKLVFVTMLAWEDPYNEVDGPFSSLDNYSILVMTYSFILSLLELQTMDSVLYFLNC